MAKKEPKKEPERMCVACRELKGKKQLLRVVKSPQGEFSLDESGKKPGRGAYICRQNQCLIKARKSKSFDKIFKIKIPDEIWQQLSDKINADEANL